MSKNDSGQEKDMATGDFAVVGVQGGSVILEANEWDLAIGVYRVVTLYLEPTNARKLADQLYSCATGAAHDGVVEH
ncbi:MAG: hypothetical protein KJN79_09435 [Gammaproteobacteria bacterium]|jgi:hypothetical protein|nr:hypothetical protein [Gammaproteobacteria bacterium]